MRAPQEHDVSEDARGLSPPHIDLTDDSLPPRPFATPSVPVPVRPPPELAGRVPKKDGESKVV